MDFFVLSSTILKKYFFVNILQNFKKINSIKHDEPRKSKDSGCQKCHRVDADNNGNIACKKQSVQKINADRSHHRTKNKIDNPFDFSPHRTNHQNQNAYNQNSRYSAKLFHIKSPSLFLFHRYFCFNLCRLISEYYKNILPNYVYTV